MPPTKKISPTLRLQPIVEQDLPFLYQVYASTREQELAQTDWDTSQKKAFLQMQFEAQHRYYQEQFPKASRQLVYAQIDDHEQAVGRLYLDRRDREIRIIDIALLPPFQGQGIGTQLLREILAEAQQKEMPVRIHVERFNPALPLYQRLGFSSVEDQGVYYLMEWLPEEVTAANDQLNIAS